MNQLIKYFPKSLMYSGVAILLVVGCITHNGPLPNLIVNGSAELPKYDSVPGGWTNVQGHWRSVEGDSSIHSYALAQEGNYLFFEGQDSLGILQQDINLDDYAFAIDDHKQSFIFSGYVRSFLQDPPDQATILIFGLDKSKVKHLYSFSSDTISSTDKWQQVQDSFLVPASTRYLRIQLVASRRNGADNDGYFDNISLTPIPIDNFNWKLVITIAIIVISGVVIIAVAKKRRERQKKS